MILKSFGSLSTIFAASGTGNVAALSREFAIGKLAAARLMDHFAFFSVAGRWIDAPGLRCCLDEKCASGGAGFAQRFPEGAHGGRTAGHLELDERIGVKLVVGRRVFDVDLAKVNLQFLGDEHRHRRIGALAHLDLAYDQRIRGHRGRSARRRSVQSLQPMTFRPLRQSVPVPAR